MNWDNPNWQYFEIQSLRGKNFANVWPTIPEVLQYTVERYGENNAFTNFVVNQRSSISYKQLAEYVEALALTLKDLGLGAGDRIVISGKNSPEWGITYLAALCAGCVVVPLDARSSAEFHKHIIEFTKTKLVFMDGDLLQRLGALESSASMYRKYLLQGKINTQGKSWENLWDLLRPYRYKVSGDLRSIVQIHCDDLAALLTTSGTTGDEKIAMLSHANLTSNVIQCVYPGLQEILSSDRIYLLLPMHHSYPMTAVFLGGLSHGSEVIFPRGMAVQQILQDLKDGQVTVFMGIPLLFKKILNGILRRVRSQNFVKRNWFYLMLKISGVADYMGWSIGSKFFARVLKAIGFDHIRILICGAGALMTEVGEKYRQLGLNFIQGYGLTEASPIVSLNPAGTSELRSVGKLLPLIEGRLEMPAELSQVANTEEGYPVGELCIDGPNKMLGYYKNAEATAEVFTPDGYLRTGDIGYFDAEGFFYLTGRCKNVIVTSGGKNIYPEEIEELFQFCSHFEQVMVHGYNADDTEKLELVVYPELEQSWLEQIQADPEKFLRFGVENFCEVIDENLKQRMLSEIKSINNRLLPYQKIDRVRFVLLPLDMTTTHKIRRFLAEKRFAEYDDGLILEASNF